MQVSKRSSSRLRRFALATATLVLGASLALAAAGPVEAQGYGWFGNLFGGGAPRPAPGAPAYPGYGGGGGYYGDSPDQGYQPRRRAPRRKAPVVVDQAPKEPKAPPKNASLFVYVFGDSLGQLLANGMDDALADRPDVAVVHDAKGSTGLVNSGYYDWPKTIADLVDGKDTGSKDAAAKDAAAKGDGKGDGKGGAQNRTADRARTDKDRGAEARDKTADRDKPADKAAPDRPAKEKIDVAVMMIGTNDRQSIREDGKTLDTGSPEWTAAYVKRIAAIDDAFRRKGIPLVWVGVPITKDDNFADDMAALNELYKEAAAKSGAIYVDTWEAFSDDSGNFSSYGPDINGQNVRLRAADGIHFTKAGARKLAHFVETHVRRALDGKTPAPQLPTADAPDEKGKGKAVAAVKPDAGPIRNLNEAPAAKDGTLAKAPAGPAAASFDTSFVHGAPQPIPPGRADDARWSANGPPSP